MVEGFADTGNGRQQAITDRAMVFMVRGIFSNWKRPIVFYFTEDTINPIDLARNLKVCIESLQNIDLHVVAIVCDQVKTNTTAVNLLIAESSTPCIEEEDCFMVGHETIVALYNAPHLLIGVRNGLLKGNAWFTYKKGEQLAKWDHIICLCESDEGDFDTRMMSKLSEQHVYKEKIKLTKIKLAAQVFSQYVSSVMRGFSTLSTSFDMMHYLLLQSHKTKHQITYPRLKY